jgi:hypothetical protein
MLKIFNISLKWDIKDFIGQKRRSNYYAVNKLGFPDAQNANLFVMYAKEWFQIN